MSAIEAIMKDVTFFIESTEYLVSARVLGNVSTHVINRKKT